MSQRKGGGPIEVVAPTPRTIVRPVGRGGQRWAESQSSTHVRWAALLALVKVESQCIDDRSAIKTKPDVDLQDLKQTILLN